jgi:hypothetical protein
VQSIIPKSNLDKIGLSLILVSSALLGIWATIHTIALRNVLLGIGSVLAIMYWMEWLVAAKKIFTIRPSFNAWISLGLIFLMFFWVVIHLVYFSGDTQRQYDELRSTWMRAFLATLIGSATGLVLTRNWTKAPLLWLGLMLSFVILIYQYLLKALQRQSIFAIDFFGDYIYWAKFNGVLAGTILIAGLLGLLIDYFRINETLGGVNSSDRSNYQKMNYFIPAYSFFGIFLATYSFVFIFDTKNGVGLAVIMVGFWVLVGFLLKAIKIFNFREQNTYIKLSGFFLIFVLLLSLLSYKHIKNNPGWENLFTDIAISAQIDKYPNWQNPSKLGVPMRNDGTAVAGNTYERVSWATVGLRMIMINPVGNGIFRSFPEQVKILVPGFNSSSYTHSAWIDLGLAFGLPGLLLIPVALLVMLGGAVMGRASRYRATIITLTLAILVLYTVGEYAFQHGIEILLYVCGLLFGISLCTAGNQVEHY